MIPNGTKCIFRVDGHPQDGQVVTTLSLAENGDRLHDLYIYNGYKRGYHLDTPILVELSPMEIITVEFTLEEYLYPLDDNESQIR